MPVMLVGFVGFLVWLLMAVALFAAWVTHVLACIKSAAWLLLIIGAFVFPLGIVHGIAIWFGIV